MSQPWPDAHLVRLAKLRLDGLSAAQIADEMGTTRCAVIGRLWRLRQRGVPLEKLAAGIFPGRCKWDFTTRPVTLPRLSFLEATE